MSLPKNLKGWLVFIGLVFAIYWAYMNLIKPRMSK